jgi:hypothetical protein
VKKHWRKKTRFVGGNFVRIPLLSFDARVLSSLAERLSDKLFTSSAGQRFLALVDYLVLTAVVVSVCSSL